MTLFSFLRRRGRSSDAPSETQTADWVVFVPSGQSVAYVESDLVEAPVIAPASTFDSPKLSFTPDLTSGSQSPAWLYGLPVHRAERFISIDVGS